MKNKDEPLMTEMVLEMRQMILKLREEVDALKKENVHLQMTSNQPMPSFDLDWLDERAPEGVSAEASGAEVSSFATNLGTPARALASATDPATEMMSSSELDACMNIFEMVLDSSMSMVSVISTVIEEDTTANLQVMAQVLKKAGHKPKRLVLPPPPPVLVQNKAPLPMFEERINKRPPPRQPRAISRFHALPDGMVVLNRSGMVLRYQETRRDNNATQLQHSPIVGEPFFEIAPYPEVRMLKQHFFDFARGKHDEMTVFDVQYKTDDHLQKMVIGLSKGNTEGTFNLVIKRV